MATRSHDKKKPQVGLDDLLTPPECAAWLQMNERVLLDNARRKRIPVVKVNARVLRFHPRSILAAKGMLVGA